MISVHSFGQDKGIQDTLRSRKYVIDFQHDLRSQLIDIDSLVNLALEHSPLLKFQDEQIRAGELQVELQQKSWHNNLFGTASAYRGNLSNIAVQDEAQLLQNSTVYSDGFRVGLAFRLPMGQFTTEKVRKRLFEAELGQKKFRKEEQILAIKRQVYFEFERLLGAQQIMKIESLGLENSLVHQDNVEKEFNSGTISISELSRVTANTVKARKSFQEAKTNFYQYLHMLEVLVGKNIEELAR